MKKITRRQFAQNSAAVGTAALLAPYARVMGANDDVRLGFIGCGGRGGHSMKWFTKTVPGVRVTAVCDADTKALGKVKKYLPPDVKGYQDLRDLIADKNVDAVVISTPNHWHSPAGILACQAGKDAYVEKPISHNIWEGRKLVEAARKYKRVVQGGTQQRSNVHFAELKQFLKEGHLGAIKYIRCNRYGVRKPIGKVSKPTPIPETVDYNLFCGPAPMGPLMRERLHYDWHWTWDFGNGEMGNWGVHILDDVRNLLDDQTLLPNRVLTVGGRVWDDDGQTPNTHSVYYDTGIVPVIFDLHNMPRKKGTTAADAYKGVRDGVVVHCENGYYAGGRGGGYAYDANGKRMQKFVGDGGNLHAKNFIDCVRSRNWKKLNGEIEIAHYSSAWCHLANIGVRVGSKYSKEKALSHYKETAAWGEVLDGFESHLAANGINPYQANIQVSPVLEIDAKKETFVGKCATKDTLALLARSYRKGFAVPDVV